MNEDHSWPNELQKQVDDAHHTTDRADAPPPGLWSHIRAQVQPQPQSQPIVETKERQPMITTATMPQSISVPIGSTPQDQAGGFRHYVNLAATVALVLAVAVGGWLAMMQVNLPGGGPEPRFAALGLQPDEAGNGVCDVEPLTVDEAIAILKDPMAHMSVEYPKELENTLIDESRQGNYLFLSPPDWDLVNEMMSYGSADIVQSDFEEMIPIANEYLDCVWNGTRGQVFRLQDPIAVQYSLTMELPILVSEEEARIQLGELFSMESGHIESNPNPELHAKVSENVDYTEYIGANLMIHNLGFYVTPVQYVDDQGNTILETDLTGAKQIGDDWSGYPQYNLAIGKSSLDGNWYVMGMYSPDYYIVTLPSD